MLGSKIHQKCKPYRRKLLFSPGCGNEGQVKYGPCFCRKWLPVKPKQIFWKLILS